MVVFITWQLVFKVLVTALAAIHGMAISTSLIISKEFKKLGYASFIILALTLASIWI